MSISDLAQRINLPDIVEAEEHLMAMVFKTRKFFSKILIIFTILD